MKYSLNQFKELIPDLSWSANELADKLSAIGHEAEVVGDQEFDITLTSNRKDCRDLRYLVFDLAGIYNLQTIDNLISHELGGSIAVTVEDINKLLGSNIGFDDLKGLERLGFVVEQGSVQPPDFRDIATKADVAEEIVRLIGFDKLNIQELSKESAPESTAYEFSLGIKLALVEAGLTETLTSSFSNHGSVKLKNPFADNEPYLRPSLQDGLLRTLAKNPYLKRAAFFELGEVFSENREETKLGIILAGYKNTEDWQTRIEAAIGHKIEFQAVDTAIAAKLAKQSKILWVEMPIKDFNPAPSEKSKTISEKLPSFKAISKFPPLVRDITLDESKQALLNDFRSENLLFSELIDEYQTNRTYRLVFQKMESSFTETEIQDIDQKIQQHFFA